MKDINIQSPPLTGLLTPRENPGTLITPAFDRYWRTHERVMWQLGNIPYDQIDSRLVTADDVATARWSTLIESHNPVVTAELLTYYRHDHEMAADAMLWGYEEFKHYADLRTYLQSPALAGFIDMEDFDRELKAARGGEWGNRERGYTPLQVVLYRGVQEIFTGVFYEAWGRNTREPVLRVITRTNGRDEIRHSEREFDKVDVEKTKVPKAQALEQIDEVLLDFDMPGLTFIPEYQRYKEPVRRATKIGVGDAVRVLRRLSRVVGKVHMLELVGRQEFRDKVADYNLDPGEVIRHFVLAR